MKKEKSEQFRGEAAMVVAVRVFLFLNLMLAALFIASRLLLL
jgi:hypothetical protein